MVMVALFGVGLLERIMSIETKEFKLHCVLKTNRNHFPSDADMGVDACQLFPIMPNTAIYLR